METSSVWTAWRRATSARIRMSLFLISSTMSSSRAANVPETESRFRSSSPIWSLRLATVSERRDSPCRVLWKAAGVSLVRSARVLIDLARRSVSILSARSARPENAWTTLYGEVGPGGGNRRVLLELAGAVRLERDEHRAQQGLDLDRRGSLVAELRGRLDLERGDHLVAVELDLGDLADPDAGDPDLVVGLEPTGLGEGGLVGVATTDQRHVLGPEGHDEQHDDHGDADRTDGDGIALRGTACSWKVAPLVLVDEAGVVLDREALAAELDVALELAQVEVEERAVDGRPADLLQLERKDLQGPVDLGPALVQVGRNPTKALDVADEGGPDARPRGLRSRWPATRSSRATRGWRPCP